MTTQRLIARCLAASAAADRMHLTLQVRASDSLDGVKVINVGKLLKRAAKRLTKQEG